jgi:hypothetical protein
MIWAICMGLALLAFALTGRWIFRDYKKLKALPAPMSSHACEVRLDEAETLLNARMTELTDLHEQSLKGIKFDPKTYVPPPQTHADAVAAELKKMADQAGV